MRMKHLTAKEKGDQVYVDFLTKRLAGDQTMKFFNTLPKIKLKSFNTKSKKIFAKGNYVESRQKPFRYDDFYFTK